MRFEVHSGPIARAAGPVFVSVPYNDVIRQAPALTDTKTGQSIATQFTPDGKLCWWADALQADESRVYELSADALAKPNGRVIVSEDHPDQVDVRIGAQAFTTYKFADDQVRPFLYPVIGPTGASVTRHYPMREGVPDERPDHPHHQSCWVAWGLINGVDHWSTGQRCGFQKHRKLLATISGPVFGQIEAAIDWVTRDGKRQLTEHRTYRFWRADDSMRLFDQSVVFHFTDGDVTFGDTKEGGICSFRVAGTMKESAGGTITNAHGATGERNCWGKPSPWMDYSGKVGGHTVGISIFDHADNFRHPTRWHIRGYGLYSANCFGLSYFTRDKNNDGSMTWKNGKSIAFNHRVLIHKGDAKTAAVGDHYANYNSPAAVHVV